MKASRCWHAALGGNTPVEIIAGFTDALVRPPPKAGQEIWPMLQKAGWTVERDERSNERARHPDGMTTVERSAGLDSDWHSWDVVVAPPTGPANTVCGARTSTTVRLGTCSPASSTLSPIPPPSPVAATTSLTPTW